VNISICIPAYKHINYLERLLNSISVQTFKDFEVVITDDSPDDNVETLLQKFKPLFKIHYYKNEQALGTPENWNEAIRKANGTWIKMMHDDDWLVNENSLQIFYDATLADADCRFFFSAYNNVDEDKNLTETVHFDWIGKLMLKQSTLNLFKKQFVGNPSCTLIRKDMNLFYDSNFKWVVDFEYYLRCFKKIKNYHYINQVLINVGVNADQVTKFTFRVPEVEIPENHLLIEKLGFGILRNIFVYDYFWRLYRNLGIRTPSDIKKDYNISLHPLLTQMIDFQKNIPLSFLRIGVISKFLMTGNYIVSLFRKS
jgi:glycosyltransferase involved in cell wall biosynthesis